MTHTGYRDSDESTPSGFLAVAAQRLEPKDSLDDFPTPPWATRALFEVVLPFVPWRRMNVWEPACGRGIMSEVIKEYANYVASSDIGDYGYGHTGLDYLTWDRIKDVDWHITNPPFKLAREFALKAIQEAQDGVALLTRLQWLEGGERGSTLFRAYPPSIVGVFEERVPMVKGRYDPRASTATAYCWVVWEKQSLARGRSVTELKWIPAGTKAKLFRQDDVTRFATGVDNV